MVKAVFVCMSVIDKMPIAPPSFARTPHASAENTMRWRKLRTPPPPAAAARPRTCKSPRLFYKPEKKRQNIFTGELRNNFSMKLIGVAKLCNYGPTTQNPNPTRAATALFTPS